MKRISLLLVLMFSLTSLVRAQGVSPQASTSTAGPGSRDQMSSEHRQKMMEMHKQQMEAMKADMEKMKSSLAQMKANVAKISDPKVNRGAGRATWICGRFWSATWSRC
jgi:TolA-binding protein